MLKTLLTALLLVLGAGVAHACNVPNPNLSAGIGNLRDGCPVPASAINRLYPSSMDGFGTGIIGTDQSPGAFGHPIAIFGGSGGTQDVLVGEVTNNATSAVLGFPTGVTGYGLNTSNSGVQAFGAFGLGTLTGFPGAAIGAEFTARNLSGHAPDTGLPPNLAIPNTTAALDGIHVTCSTVTGTNDCSVGEIIGNESGNGANPNFNTGIYVELFRQFGLVVESQLSGNQTSALIKNNGTGTALQLQSTGSLTPNNTMLSSIANGNTTFSVRQSGSIFSTGKLEFSQSARPTVSSCGTTPNVNSSTDQAGIITAGTGTVTACTITFATAFQNIPSCTITGEGSGSVGYFISTKSVSAMTVGNASNFAGLNFDYHCIDQN